MTTEAKFSKSTACVESSDPRPAEMSPSTTPDKPVGGTRDAAGSPAVDSDPKGKLHEVLEQLVVAKQALAQGQVSIERVQRSVKELGAGTARLEEAFEELASKQADISHQATHDELTGLPNRALLLDRFEQATAQAARQGGSLALLFIDLDHFKCVNDQYGHRAGDEVLREIAIRLRTSLRASDTAGRYGGDEFVVLLNSLDAQQNPWMVAEKILETLNRPYTHGTVQLTLMASIGMAAYPNYGTAWDDLVHHADLDMYRLRSAQRGA